MNVFAKFDEIPSKILKVIKETKRNRHTHTHTHGRKDGQRENSIPTHKYSLPASPYFFISSICLVHMNVFAKFDEIPLMILKVIKETKRIGHTHTHGRKDRQRENSIPTHKHSLRGV